ncbi:fumarylacetoacetate hydrolase family protein [Corynebacterium jeikeium]|uniref:fumarylacetoacetate hydrolase family protein n=1 Tax=Corynebacterium jeikeium TaxID=38289 RepID=UPI0002FC9FEB|nr:fumarylacetoacetate hydrolase family protein [Corynebacterium jeikeium]OOD32219.1 2-hydroxyhepta-2,4-diene-1,7-dioate isomerase [Corynebacterium jeikeium]WCZ53899.1 Ureidoglycolate lyase [Corynebacterium jeikeium]SUY80797.1 2-hydroxyhepta-2,4-diene-1,7-dioate isomerase [Corynebacterium jeikeium]
MRIARIAHPEGMAFAIVEGGEPDGTGATLREIAGHPFGQPEFTGKSWPIEDVRLLAPILPSKVIAVGRNYADHVEEVFNKSAEHLPPTIFLKPPTAVIGPEAPIRIPEWATRVEFEGEMAIVIGRPCKDVNRNNWKDVVLGFTVVNDVSSRDLQFQDGQWSRAKGLDSFCPLGPWIETAVDSIDIDNQPILAHLTHEGKTETKQDSNSNQMIKSIPEIVEWVSSAFTLLPGDVICTGSPAGTAEMVPGDRIEVEIPGLGKLANPVQAYGN